MFASGEVVVGFLPSQPFRTSKRAIAAIDESARIATSTRRLHLHLPADLARIELNWVAGLVPAGVAAACLIWWRRQT